MLYRGKSSLFYILSSFVGALLVAGSFAYNNYRFSRFKFIDFSKTILYTQNDIFTPKKDYYYMLIFSSHQTNPDKLISKIPKNYPIIIIDMYQKEFKSKKGEIFTRVGSNTFIKIIQKFNIYNIPVYFRLKRYNKNLFKQDSALKEIK